MDLRHLDVENLDFGIDECNEFNPFEYEETPTPSSVPHSNFSQPNPIGKWPRVSRRTYVVWNHYTIINRQNTTWEVENLAYCKYFKKAYSCKASDAPSLFSRHAKHCTKKHGALDPRQSQISQTKLGSSTSSISPFIYNQQFLRERLVGMVATMRLPLTFGEDPRFIHFINNPLLYTINNSTSP